MTNEESALWDVYIQTGRTDIAIRNRLVEMHYGWALDYAKAVCMKRTKDHALADEASANAVGKLLRLVERYDPSRGIPFEKYALSTIAGQAMESLRNRRLFTGRRAISLSKKGTNLISLNATKNCNDKLSRDVPIKDDPSKKIEGDEFWGWVRSVLDDKEASMMEAKFLRGANRKCLLAEFGPWYPNIERNAQHKLARAMGRERIKQGCGQRRRPVRCVDTGAEYASATDAFRATGIAHSTIWRSATRGYKAGGFRWRWL
jgi:hypothetical protein